MITLLLAGLTLLPSASAVSKNSVVSDHELYSQLYPVHAEFCAGTKFQFIGGVSGGVGGHGFTYVHGLCKDDSKNYPQVKVCDGSEDHQGVGISVNSDFRNVNWVAVPTHSLLIDGNLAEGETVTEKTLDRIADEANRRHVFDGVIIDSDLTKSENGDSFISGSDAYLRATAINSEGTDIGVRLARNLECVRVPFPYENLEKIAKTLNKLNDSYYFTDRSYAWSGPKDNCTHVATQILADAGIRDAIPKDSYLHPAVPRNNSYTLMQIGVFRSTKASDVYSRKEDRESISTEYWMPTQVGVLAKKIWAFPDNKVFEISDKGLWFLPKNPDHFAEARAAFSSPRAENSEIGANLFAWEERYTKELERTQSEKSIFDSKAYTHFKSEYADYLRSKLHAVQSQIERFGFRKAKTTKPNTSKWGLRHPQ
jgi:hypothetical protein